MTDGSRPSLFMSLAMLEVPAAFAPRRRLPVVRDDELAPWSRDRADCRGPGVCPVLRCEHNVLLTITRSGDTETIVVGGRGGTGKGLSLPATERGTRTAAGRMSDAEVDAIEEQMADMIVDLCDRLPSTCKLDYLEKPDLLPARPVRSDGVEMTLEQVAATSAVTREAVRRVEMRALARLRAMMRGTELDPEHEP